MKVGYVRVSTDEQNTARQEEMMKHMGVEKVFVEKISGKDTDRPELQALLDYVREGDTVVVESYSRFARSTRDLLNLLYQLESKGVEFISVKENFDTSTPQGELMLTIFAGLAQFEREVMLQRQREGIEIAKAAGKYKGRRKKQIPDFMDYYKKVQTGDMTVTKACEELRISRSTWYHHLKTLDRENT